METSPTIKEIANALIEFHKNMGKVSKSETNPFFKSKYADLSTILSSIKDPLEKAGLVITQFPVGENELETLLAHAGSGEWIKGRYKMTPSKNDPQGQGSLITYQRRYAIGAVLSLNIDEDDDGNKASVPQKKATPTAEPSELARQAIGKAGTVKELTALEKRIKVSTVIPVEVKDELISELNEKVMTLDPTI